MCKYFHEILMTVFLFISNQLCTTTEKANFVVLPKGSMQKKRKQNRDLGNLTSQSLL